MKKNTEEMAHVDTNADSIDSPTASTVAPTATATARERCCECGSRSVTNHKFWYGNFLPMCRHCFATFIERNRA